MDIIKVLIVEDHVLMADGYRLMLDSADDISVAGEAPQSAVAFDFLENEEVDVILMDIQLKNSEYNGMEITELVTKKFPDIKVLALTMKEEGTYIQKMLEAGAKGFIFKGSTRSKQLIEAIRAVANGQEYYPADVSQVQREYWTNGTRSSQNANESLTPREIEILYHIVQGKTSPQIAEELFISRRTVDTHRSNMMDKIGCNNAAGLIKWAIEHEYDKPTAPQK